MTARTTRNGQDMGQNGHAASNVQIDLAHFEAKDSSDGRLLHYAQGRIGSFWLRQTLTLFGALIIFLLSSPPLGLTLAALALAGEGVEIALLLWVIQRLQGGKTGPATRRMAMGGAAIQGMTIAACVALCWHAIPVHEARFFAASFLIAASINAGLARPHFRAGADIKLALYLATGVAMMARDLQEVALATSPEYAYFAASFLLLTYISLLFIRLLERTYEHRRNHQYALLKHQHEQEMARHRLAAVDRNSQRLALVAKYANDSILISGPDGRIVWVNDAFTRITGYGFSEAVGRMPADLLNAPGTDQATLDRLQHARDTCTPLRAEILNRAKSGRSLWMETSIIPIMDEAGQLQLWIAVERDISEAKEREAELARAHHTAEEAVQSKSRFLANMSHEIRTPMNGVIGVAELLSETRLTAVQAGYVATIRDSGQALMAIINDILDLAKLQSGKSRLQSDPFSPRECIEAVLRILGPSATKKGLDLHLNGPDLDRLVLGDEGKLRQILLNLIGNAIKFTHAGTVSVTLHWPSETADLIEIAVADTGIGIAPSRIGTIFESFSQADDGIGRQFGGTGLGLTICAMLAEQMGGGIAVQSDVGKGSVFTLRARLPLTDGTRQVAPIERRSLPRLRPGLTILVAEDNRTNMMIVRKMLQGFVARIVAAQDGEQAVAQYRRHPPDLILMDLSMPVKDGLQATRDIRAHEGLTGLPPCPIIALTANAFGEDREACRRAGLDGFLVKPLSRTDLLTAISQHCPDVPPRAQAIGL